MLGCRANEVKRYCSLCHHWGYSQVNTKHMSDVCLKCSRAQRTRCPQVKEQCAQRWKKPGKTSAWGGGWADSWRRGRMEGSDYSTRKSQPALPKHVRCNLKQGESTRWMRPAICGHDDPRHLWGCVAELLPFPHHCTHSIMTCRSREKDQFS